MVEREEGTVEDTVVFGIRWDGGRRPRIMRGLVALFVALAAALTPGVASAAPAHHGLRTALVVPAHGRDAAARALVQRLGGHAGRRIRVAGGFAAKVPAGALARLERSPAVRTAAPDVALSVRSAGDEGAAAASSDVVRSESGAAALGDAGTDGAGVGVALVDSGAMDLPALRGRVVRGPDFSSEAGDADLRGLDTFGHGTHLAGVIAGDDAADGFEGVAPSAHVVSVKVADARGDTSLVRVLAALDWIRVHHADRGVDVRVVNLSLGVAPTAASYVREPLAFAVEQLWRDGLVVVAAAGNGGPRAGQLDLPAADPFVIAVGGLDTAGTADRADDGVAAFSSHGGSRAPDVLAPATRIVSLRVPGSTLDRAFPAARIGDGYFRGSGTSQATAVVSGLVALLLERRPDLDPDQVKALLVAGAVPVAGEDDGPGAVDAAASAALLAPSVSRAAQDWTPAILDLHRLDKHGRGRGDGNALHNARWAGSTWSGSTWSGSTWSGSTWSGSTWSGSTWSSAGWDGP